MLARDIKPATRAVLDVTDKRALGAAKRSLVIMSEALNIPVTNFPKPTMEAVRHFDGELWQLKENNAECDLVLILFITAFVTSHIFEIPIEMSLSCFAYMLADQGFIVDFMQGSWEEFETATMQINLLGNNSYTLGSEVEIFEKAHISVCSRDTIDKYVEILTLSKDYTNDAEVRSRFEENCINILSCYGTVMRSTGTLHYDLSGTWKTLSGDYETTGDNILNGHIEYLLLLWAYSTLSKYDRLIPRVMPTEYLRKVEQVSYYFAAIGFTIKCYNVQFSETDMYMLSNVVSETNRVNIEALHNVITYTDLLSIKFIRAESTDFDLFPVDLLRHMESLGSAKAIMSEVCRLQKLSPTSMLAEDPQKALINAWKNMLRN